MIFNKREQLILKTNLTKNEKKIKENSKKNMTLN